MKKSDLKFFSEEKEEEHVVTYFVESSFDHDDKDRTLPEYIVVGADYGEMGTKTVATFDGMENLEAVKDFVNRVLPDPYSAL